MVISLHLLECPIPKSNVCPSVVTNNSDETQRCCRCQKSKWPEGPFIEISEIKEIGPRWIPRIHIQSRYEAQRGISSEWRRIIDCIKKVVAPVLLAPQCFPIIKNIVDM